MRAGWLLAVTAWDGSFPASDEARSKEKQCHSPARRATVHLCAVPLWPARLRRETWCGGGPGSSNACA
jgi:hypothetical protein